MDLQNFQQLYSLCNEDAASFFRCSRSTIQKWRSGSIDIPPVVEAYIDLLHSIASGRTDFFRRIQEGSLEDVLAQDYRRENCDIFKDISWIIMSPKILLWSWFPDSTLVRVSRNVEDNWGLSPTMMEGKRWLDFVQFPGERVLAEEFLRKTILGGGETPQRFRLTLPGERYGRFLIHNVPLNTGESSKLRTSLLVDVTAEERETAKAIALDQTLDSVFGEDRRPMIVLRKDGVILCSNKKMRRLLGRITGPQGNNVFELLEGKWAYKEAADILNEVPGEGVVPVTLAIRSHYSAGARTVNGCLRRCQWKGTSAFLFVLSIGRDQKFPQASKRVVKRRITGKAGLLFRSAVDASYAFLADDEQTYHQISLLGRKYEAMRAYVFEYDSDFDLLSNTVEWCTDGIEPQMDGLQHSRFSQDTPWWFDLMSRGKPVLAPCIESLPSEAFLEKGILEAQDIRGLAAFPLWQNGKLFGFVGLDFERSFDAFNKDVLEDLSICARTISEKRNLLRLQADHSLKLKHAGTFFREAEIASYRWDCVKDLAWLTFDGADILRLPTKPGNSLPDAKAWLLRHIHPDDRPLVTESLQQFVMMGSKATHLDYRFTHDFEVFTRIEHFLFVEKWDERGIPLEAIAFLRRKSEVSRDLLTNSEPDDSIKEFVSRLAHDLKTPLHLLENLRNHGDPEIFYKNTLVDHMQKIRSIIDLAENLSSNEKPVAHSVSLERLGSEVAEALHGYKSDEAPDLFLEADPPTSISIDLTWLLLVIRLTVRVFAPLTRCGFGDLRISFEPTDESGGTLVLKIQAEWSDSTKIGPLQAFHENVLALEGNGSNPELELALRRLDIMGGSCEIQQNGLSFSLPCEVVSWERKNLPSGTGVMSSVLLVEDHDLIRKITFRQLEKAGFDVTAVPNGREALSWMEKNPVDLVLLDIQMPIMNGFQFLDKYYLPDFAQHRAKKGVFVLSALEGNKYRRDLEQYPILGFLSKPFSLQSLVEKLETLQSVS